MTIRFFASGDIETIQIELSPDEGLVGTHPDAQQSIEFAWADEPPWSFEANASKDGVPAPMLSSSDVELLMGCGVENLARSRFPRIETPSIMAQAISADAGP